MDLTGDTTAESIQATSELTFNGNTRMVFEFDPSLLIAAPA